MEPEPEPAAAQQRPEDPELRPEGPRTDLHSLRAADPALDALSAHIQLTVSRTALATFARRRTLTAARGGEQAAAAAVDSLQRDDAERSAALRGQRILVTGSAGYVGAALCLALGGLGAEAVGLDVVQAETVAIEADVADAEAVRAAVAGCDGILHTAARHAPHAAHYHESDFIATNVAGTQNVLDAAVAAGGIPVVHTSTTSLTITKRVKAAEKAGRIVWLDESAQPPVDATDSDDPLDRPRNKYGRSKLEAERRCVKAAAAGLPCAIVRISRCFPEDVLPEEVLPGKGALPRSHSVPVAAAALSTPNFKANELLGRRVALLDALAGHLRALTRAREPAVQGRVLTLSAPFPWDRSTTPTDDAAFGDFVREQRPHLAALYARLGWLLPESIGRVYDSSRAVDVLGWRPAVTFDALVAALGGEAGAKGISLEDAEAGRY